MKRSRSQLVSQGPLSEKIMKIKPKQEKSENIKTEWIKQEIKDETTPRMKLPKLEQSIKPDPDDVKKVKQEVKVTKPETHLNGNNKPFWELGRQRRIFVEKYRGKELVHIRVFYPDENSGTSQPGKKGITLTKDEWFKMLAIQKEIKFEN